MTTQAPVVPEPRAVARAKRTVAAYVALTKPRIIELLLVTTLPTMVVAQRGLPPVWLMVATLVGGALAAGGANAINMVVDRDIDRLMKRTKNRPLVTGAMTPRAALVFALTLEVAAFVEPGSAVNLLSAVLAVSATLFYVFVYTLWLKRRSTQNIVIGGAAGAVPVLVGWAAVTTRWPGARGALRHHLHLDPAALLVPRRALPGRLRGGRRAHAAGRGLHEAHHPEIVLLHGGTGRGVVAFGPVAHLGWIYMISAAVLGGGFLYFVTRLWGLARKGTVSGPDAMRVFSYSITYLTVLFVAMAGDVLIRNQLH